MKTNEFVKEVEALGFNGKIFSETMVVINVKNGNYLLTIGGKEVYKIDCFYNAYDNLAPYTREKLFKLAVEYASTPLEEREEEKKYYIVMRNISGENKYLNIIKHNEKCILNNNRDNSDYKTQFTKSEIKEYGLDKFADNELFELVEVK